MPKPPDDLAITHLLAVAPHSVAAKLRVKTAKDLIALGKQDITQLENAWRAELARELEKPSVTIWPSNPHIAAIAQLKELKIWADHTIVRPYNRAVDHFVGENDIVFFVGRGNYFPGVKVLSMSAQGLRVQIPPHYVERDIPIDDCRLLTYKELNLLTIRKGLIDSFVAASSTGWEDRQDLKAVLHAREP